VKNLLNPIENVREQKNFSLHIYLIPILGGKKKRGTVAARNKKKKKKKIKLLDSYTNRRSS